MNTPHIRSVIGVLLGPILFWNAGNSTSVHSTLGSKFNGMNRIRFTRDMHSFAKSVGGKIMLSPGIATARLGGNFL